MSKHASLSRNSCAKAFGKWSRHSDLRPKHRGVVCLTPPTPLPLRLLGLNKEFICFVLFVLLIIKVLLFVNNLKTLVETPGKLIIKMTSYLNLEFIWLHYHNQVAYIWMTTKIQNNCKEVMVEMLRLNPFSAMWLTYDTS